MLGLSFGCRARERETSSSSVLLFALDTAVSYTPRAPTDVQTSLGQEAPTFLRAMQPPRMLYDAQTYCPMPFRQAERPAAPQGPAVAMLPRGKEVGSYPNHSTAGHMSTINLHIQLYAISAYILGLSNRVPSATDTALGKLS